MSEIPLATHTFENASRKLILGSREEIRTLRTNTQQIIAGDCLQLRSFLTTLPAAPELGRSAVARGLVASGKIRT